MNDEHKESEWVVAGCGLLLALVIAAAFWFQLETLNYKLGRIVDVLDRMATFRR